MARWLEAMAAAGVPWDTYTYNAQLTALVRTGRHDDAWALYREMEAPPDHVTFHIILRDSGAWSPHPRPTFLARARRVIVCVVWAWVPVPAGDGA
jgi:pentatricopeptide repeat protein